MKDWEGEVGIRGIVLKSVLYHFNETKIEVWKDIQL